MAERENRRGRDWAWGKYLPDAEEKGVSVGERLVRMSQDESQVVSGLAMWVLVIHVLR